MSSLAVTNTLMSVFVPIGIAGAVIALVCALVAAFALMRGAAGLAGGAVGVWIVGALLSMAASFANLWTPVVVSLIALGAAVIAGPVLRVLVRAASAAGTASAARREAEPALVAAPAIAPPAPTASKAAVRPTARPSSRTEALPIAS